MAAGWRNSIARRSGLHLAAGRQGRRCALEGDPEVKKARGKGCQYKRRPAGDYLLAASADNRLAIERWSEGAPVAHTFGRGIVFYLIHGRLAVRNLDSELMVLDEATGSELRRLQFPDRIVPAGFRADGGQLGVVTADQRMYTFAMP